MGKPHALFRFRGERFALPVAHVQEVVGELEVTPLPRAGAGWIGVGNLRGEIVPAATLAPWFSAAPGGTRPSAPSAIFLILNTPQGKLALAADGFEHVAAIPTGAVEPLGAADGEPDFVPGRWRPAGNDQPAVRCLDAPLLADRLRIVATADAA